MLTKTITVIFWLLKVLVLTESFGPILELEFPSHQLIKFMGNAKKFPEIYL